MGKLDKKQKKKCDVFSEIKCELTSSDMADFFFLEVCL